MNEPSNTFSAPPILQVRNIHKTFILPRPAPWLARPRLHAVQGVSFSLYPGELLGLVGESGCGKSTLARCITLFNRPDVGEINLESTNITSLGAAALRPHRLNLQMVFQDPHSALNPRLTLHQTLAEPLRAHSLCPPSHLSDRVSELLNHVGLGAEHAARYPFELSGGQKQRAVIARALAPNPKVLICDEPVSALDMSIQAQILNLLEHLRQTLGLAILFISHDLAAVRALCSRTMVMHQGQIIEQGPTSQIVR